jgi:hypothetical protein
VAYWMLFNPIYVVLAIILSCRSASPTRLLRAALTALVLTHLFCLSEGASCSSSYEMISFDPCPADQTYIIGAPSASAPNTITSNGTQCGNSDVYFSNQTVVA